MILKYLCPKYLVSSEKCFWHKYLRITLLIASQSCAFSSASETFVPIIHMYLKTKIKFKCFDTFAREVTTTNSMNLETNQLEDVSNIGLNHKKGICIGLFEEVLFLYHQKYLFMVSTSITLPSLLEGLVLFLFIMSRNSRKFNLSLPVYKTFFVINWIISLKAVFSCIVPIYNTMLKLGWTNCLLQRVGNSILLHGKDNFVWSYMEIFRAIFSVLANLNIKKFWPNLYYMILTRKFSMYSWIQIRAGKSKSLIRWKRLRGGKRRKRRIWFTIRLLANKYLISGDVLNPESEGSAPSHKNLSRTILFSKCS